MRGSRELQVDALQLGGIIPAHAGLTVGIYLGNGMVRDHPRACGAHPFLDDYENSEQGSSPRMRGSLFNKYKDNAPMGIIPAHAGLTVSFLAQPCEEAGSSPRMRGSH